MVTAPVWILINMAIALPFNLLPTKVVETVMSIEVDGWSVGDWQNYLKGYSLIEWAIWAAEGGAYSVADWHIWYRQRYEDDTWSRLSWTLDFLGFKFLKPWNPTRSRI